MSKEKCLLVLIVVITVIFLEVNIVAAIRCDRNPEGFSANKSPADGRFRLKITGNPEKYAPGETYTSKLKDLNDLSKYF